MRKSLAFLTVVALISIAGYVAGVFALCKIVEWFPSVGPFVFMDTHGSTAFGLRSAILQPAAFMAAMAICLAFDAMCVGLDQSSLKRLLDSASASTRVDLFYMVLRLAGGINVLIFVFSFGTLIWIVNHIHRVLHIGVLQNVHSFVLQFAIVFLINTFMGYWTHRLMHTRFMWEIHKVHHAAEEMNIVTTFRNHPVEQLLMSIIHAVPVALLGAATPVIFTYTAVNMIYGSLSHSEINLKSKLWDLFWITPAAHRIHHSTRLEHFDTNFGVITLWDYLFGTYHLPTNEKLQYGIDDGAAFNRPRFVLEIFDNVRRWIRPLWSSSQQSQPGTGTLTTERPSSTDESNNIDSRVTLGSETIQHRLSA